MSEAWKKLDLEGDGLQSANVALSKVLKKRSTAFALLAAFPLGLHRDYLASPAGAWAYRGAAIAAVALLFTPYWQAAALLGAGLTAAAAFDIRWIDDRVAALNKAARRRLTLRKDLAPPPGYRGRQFGDELEQYVKDKETERAGHGDSAAPQHGSTASRMPSFAQQEALLKEIARAKEKRKPPDTSA